MSPFFQKGMNYMTIIEAINKIDNLKPNDYTQSEKIEWLSRLDGMIKKEVIDTHIGSDKVIFNGYTEETPLNTVLLVGEPYDDMYISWLEAKIDYSNSEYVKYNNSITKFNDTYSAFSKYYNRQNMPKGTNFQYF